MTLWKIWGVEDVGLSANKKWAAYWFKGWFGMLNFLCIEVRTMNLFFWLLSGVL